MVASNRARQWLIGLASVDAGSTVVGIRGDTPPIQADECAQVSPFAYTLFYISTESTLPVTPTSGKQLYIFKLPTA